MEINIDKSQVMRVSRSNESLQIKVHNRELKELGHFMYLGSERTRNGYCTREIKIRISIANDAFNRKMPLLTSKLTLNSRRNWLDVIFYHCFIWLRDLDTKKLERKY